MISDDDVFEWEDYFKLALSFKNENNPAKLRTGIGRFYYSPFLESRDYLLEKEIFLNTFSKTIMKSKSGRVHQETRHIFNNHQSLNKKNTGKKIAQRLNILRKYRNMVDYDLENPKNLKHVYNRCLSKSKRIFELLDELN